MLNKKMYSIYRRIKGKGILGVIYRQQNVLGRQFKLNYVQQVSTLEGLFKISYYCSKE